MDLQSSNHTWTITPFLALERSDIGLGFYRSIRLLHRVTATHCEATKSTMLGGHLMFCGFLAFGDKRSLAKSREGCLGDGPG